MRNIDKYENEIREKLEKNRCIAVDIHTNKLLPEGNLKCTECLRHNTECEENSMIRWLLEEYKEMPILEEKEKKYLENVLRPFQNKIIYIRKTIAYGNAEYIWISIAEWGDKIADTITLPQFKLGTMYKGMEVNKCYSPKELGLFEGE